MGLGMIFLTEVTELAQSGYNTYRGWTQIKYRNRHNNIDQKDEGT
jgi:hypothetical protein